MTFFHKDNIEPNETTEHNIPEPLRVALAITALLLCAAIDYINREE